MTTFTFRIPKEWGINRGPVLVVMVIERANLDRILEADPFNIKFIDYRRHMPEDVLNVRLKDVDLVIAYEEDAEKLMEFQKSQNIPALMEWLERGRGRARDVRVEDGQHRLPVKVVEG